MISGFVLYYTLLVFAIKAVEKPDISPKYPAFGIYFAISTFAFPPLIFAPSSFLIAAKALSDLIATWE